MLLRHKSDDPAYADLIQIHQNANRAAALVGQLLAFSRKQTMKPERIDLEEALGDLTHLLNRLVGERIDLRLTQDPAVGPLRADRRQLDQVIMNLVVNARDAMPDGGLVQVETGVRVATGLLDVRSRLAQGASHRCPFRHVETDGVRLATWASAAQAVPVTQADRDRGRSPS